MAEPRRAAIRRLAGHLGLVPPGPGVMRSRWARIFNVDRDSSQSEALVGLLLGVVLILMVGRGFLEVAWWFRPIVAIALVVLIGNVIRVAALRIRRP